MSLDTFERSLLTELRQYVAARTPAPTEARTADHRGWILGLSGAGLAVAAAAAVISLGIGIAGPTAAWAVEAQPDGDLVVTVHDLSDASGLERALAAKGVRTQITYEPGFSQTDGQTRSTSGGDRGQCTIALAKVDGGLRFTLSATEIASGAQLDIVTAGSSRSDVGSPVAVTWSGGSC